MTAVLTGVLAPVAALAGLPPLPGLSAPGVRVLGVTVAALGLGGSVAAQVAMGDSWRVGVDRAERTGLVTGGSS